MTDHSVLKWVHEVLGVGTLGEKIQNKIHCWMEKNNGDGVVSFGMHI